MGTEAERQDTRKEIAYDIIQILKEKPEKQSYTEEINYSDSKKIAQRVQVYAGKDANGKPQYRSFTRPTKAGSAL